MTEPCRPGAWGSIDHCATHDGLPLTNGRCVSGPVPAQPESEVDISEWPELLRSLVKLIGERLTRELAAKCGGIAATYIPTKINPKHDWAKVLGEEAWAKVVETYGGQRLELPMGARLGVPMKRRILELAAAGLSNREIARKLHVGERWVRRVVNDVDGIAPTRQRGLPDPRQLGLFGGGGNDR